MALRTDSWNLVKPEREDTFFDHARSQLKLPLFAAGLRNDGRGSYDFGFYNRSRYTGELTYVDVDSSNGHWSFTAGSYDLGDGEIVHDPHEGVIGKFHNFFCFRTPYRNHKAKY